MNIVKSAHNANQIKILNYQVNKIQAEKLREVGIASNVNSNGSIFTLIVCKNKVTDADIETVKRLL